MKHVFWAALALTFGGSVLAAEQGYTAQADLVPFGSPLDYQTYGYMEVWGVGNILGNTSRYATPATDTGDVYHYLISSSEGASALALGGLSSATARFSYDPTASPYFTSATGNSARYNINPISIDFAGSGVAPVSLTAPNVSLNVARTTNLHSQYATFATSSPTVDGPLPGSTFSYPAPAGGPFLVDLVDLLGPTAYFSNGFDLSAFTTLPVRLAAPTVLRPVALSIQLGRSDAGASYGISPPGTLALGDWNLTQSVYVFYDGVYGVTVSAADYGSNSAFLAAQSWVTGNIRQINFEQQVEYSISGLAPVPELPTAWLMLLGLVPSVLGRRRPD